jgi:cytochrome c oxidase accessory protein FixG
MSCANIGGPNYGNPTSLLPIATGRSEKSGPEQSRAEQGGCRKCGGCEGDNRCGRQTVSIQRSTPASGSALLDAPEHVLSTLEKDGSRRWLWPKLSPGRFWQRRRIVGYALIAFFVTLPHLRYAGKPPLLLDIPARQLTVMGHTFLPTDTVLLALAMLGTFFTIIAATTLTGRVWCGWACPQTVYTEFLFRPIDRLFEGTRGKGGKPRRQVTGGLAVARFVIYLVLSMALAHTFLSYFVGTDRLATWITSRPTKHPIAFAVMIFTTVAMLYDFLFFREQLCLIACPYGRFQSVMLDRKSLIVGYDELRGEPRGRLKKAKPSETQDDSAKANGSAKTGDCIDCKLCVMVCPTGIDIRNGLQMECINCTQCIDACDSVMDKIGKPRGLIRYSSQDGLTGQPSSKLRPRMLLYPTLIGVVLAAFLLVLSTKSTFDATILRGQGNPYTFLEAGRLQNSLRLRLVNRSGKLQEYQISVVKPEGLSVEVMLPDRLKMQPGESYLLPLSVTFPSKLPGPANSAGQGGPNKAIILITDSDNQSREVSFNLLGPKQ